MLFNFGVKARTMSKELLDGLPTNGGKMYSALIKVSPHRLVTSRDHELSAEHVHLGSDMDVRQRVILRSPTIYTTTTGDFQMSS